MFRNQKLYGHFEVQAKVSYTYTQYKIYDWKTELKIFQIQCCVFKVVTTTVKS